MKDIRRFERENTVAAEKQVAELIFRSEKPGAPRILFIGNSITLHGIKPEIDWHGLWGMAASERENDYVHQTMRMVRGIAPEAGYMIAQAADWERGFWRDPEKFECLRMAREYDADIVVIRLGENVLEDTMREHDFQVAFERMIDYFNPSGRTKMIVTNLFWPNPAKDACIEAAAKSRGAALVDINHLGMMDEMKALGLFEHAGVAAHPGDLGMLRIAEAVFRAMEPVLKDQLKKSIP